jgi:hypothetical protein
MNQDYRVTPEQWADAEYYGNPDRQPCPIGEYACILELRARVEALETTQHAHVDTSQLSEARREQIRQELAKRPAHQPAFAELLMPPPRLKPLSLKEVALNDLDTIQTHDSFGFQIIDLSSIRRALEQLPDAL